MAEANWYVVHTYSVYENKVKADIEKTIENRHLEDEILEVRILLRRNPFCTDYFRYRVCGCRNPDVLCMAGDPVRYLRTW